MGPRGALLLVLPLLTQAEELQAPRMPGQLLHWYLLSHYLPRKEVRSWGFQGLLSHQRTLVVARQPWHPSCPVQGWC